jgi:hypothetical protein
LLKPAIDGFSNGSLEIPTRLSRLPVFEQIEDPKGLSLSISLKYAFQAIELVAALAFE